MANNAIQGVARNMA